MSAIVQDRMVWLESISIEHGSHGDIDKGCCVMEAVAYVAGEPHSDHPQCACPIITSFLISWNDNLQNDADRDRLLKPLVPQIVGTRSTKEIEQKRGLMAADWLIREFTATWLDMVPSLKVHAEVLRKSPEIVDVAGMIAITPVLASIGKEAFAARDAAGDAAWAAAGAAARAAAGAAALKPTVERLQSSAADLVKRMIDCQPQELPHANA